MTFKQIAGRAHPSIHTVMIVLISFVEPCTLHVSSLQHTPYEHDNPGCIHSLADLFIVAG